MLLTHCGGTCFSCSYDDQSDLRKRWSTWKAIGGYDIRKTNSKLFKTVSGHKAKGSNALMLASNTRSTFLRSSTRSPVLQNEDNQRGWLETTYSRSAFLMKWPQLEIKLDNADPSWTHSWVLSIDASLSCEAHLGIPSHNTGLYNRPRRFRCFWIAKKSKSFTGKIQHQLQR